jgi:hypothetical protein
MIQIQPYKATDKDILATQLEIHTENLIELTVDAVWFLYDDAGQYVNDGRMQLAGDDFIAYLSDNEYAIDYIINQKGIIKI